MPDATPKRNLVTPAGTLASNPASIFKAQVSPKAKPDASGKMPDPSFYARLLFTHDALDTAEWKALLAGLETAGKARFGDKFAKMQKGGILGSPIKQDIENQGYDPDTYAAYLHFHAYPDAPPQVKDITGRLFNANEAGFLYAGAQLRVSYYCTAYGGLDTGYKPGMNVKLCHVLKVGDGPRLSARGATADEDFGGIEGYGSGAATGGEDINALLG
jgi:hypothetical protein